MHEEAVHIERRMRAENVFRLGEDVFDESAGDDAQRNLAIDAAESQVVDLVAERRNIGPLGGVHLHGQHVLSVEIDMRREVEGEGRVAALVFAEAHAVDPDGGGGHHAFKIHENALAVRFRRQLEAAAIDGDELIGLVVEAVPGQADIGVRNRPRAQTRIVEIARVCCLRQRCCCTANCG